ncbi:MAG: acyltransferase [Burkholderiaceae bacterium]
MEAALPDAVPDSHPTLHSAEVIPSLDGIRALAVALVFTAHSGFQAIIPGGLGVTIFFVLSGYLITTIMRVEYTRRRTIGFRAFYLRRLLRLMPPLLIVVIAAALLSMTSVIGGAFTLGGLLSTLFYCGNYYIIAHDFRGLPAGLGVIWSLAIEEHYYFLYPPLAGLLLRARRPGRSVLLLFSLCGAVVSWRFWLTLHGASSDYLMMATDTRVDAILIGCAMAIGWNPRLDPVAPSNAPRDLAVAGACVVVLVGTLLYRDEAFRSTLRYTLQALAVAPLIYLAVARSDEIPFSWLNCRPIVYVGTISYTIYLVHDVILSGLAKHWPQLTWAWLMILGASLTIVVAETMRRWVDKPCARLRAQLHRRYLPTHGTAGAPSIATP